MATVHITYEIRRYAKEKLTAIYDKQADKLFETIDLNALAQECFLFSTTEEYRNLAHKLNSDPDGKWFNSRSGCLIEVQFDIQTGDGPASKTVTKYFYVDRLSPELLIPVRNSNPNPTAQLYLLPHMPSYQKISNILRNVELIRNEKDITLHTLFGLSNGVLFTNKTLAKVLKVWPSALQYMPEDAVKKHMTKYSSKKPKAASNNEIPDNVKLSLIKMQMLASGD